MRSAVQRFGCSVVPRTVELPNRRTAERFSESRRNQTRARRGLRPVLVGRHLREQPLHVHQLSDVLGVRLVRTEWLFLKVIPHRTQGAGSAPAAESAVFADAAPALEEVHIPEVLEEGRFAIHLNQGGLANASGQ